MPRPLDLDQAAFATGPVRCRPENVSKPRTPGVELIEITKWLWGAALAGMAVLGLFLASASVDSGMYIHGLIISAFGVAGVFWLIAPIQVSSILYLVQRMPI